MNRKENSHALINDDYNVSADVPTNGGLREYSVFRFHSGGNIDLYLYYSVPPGLRENPPAYLSYPMRFGMRDAGGRQPNASIVFNLYDKWKSFGYHAPGNYAMNARFGGPPYNDGSIAWRGILRLKKYSNV